MEGLQHLLKAPSKKVVDQIIVAVYKNRVGQIDPEITASLVNALSLTQEQAIELVESVRYLTKNAVYENSNDLSDQFPSNFHKDLKGLILQIVGAHLSEWREEALKSQCSLPRLHEVDWRIDVKRASENISNMSVPTVLVQLKVEDSQTANGVKTVDFELNKQTLDIMIDGLSNIKSQLASLK